MTQADVVVIGAGPAGYVCAIRLAQNGKKVTVIDKAEVGGVCLNRGCIPSKALIYAGTLYEKMSHAATMGIEVSGVKVKMPKLIEWKNGVVNKLTSGIGQLLKANGCTVISGDAKFTGPKTLEVTTSKGKETLSFNHCVIATGSRPTEINGFKVDQETILDSTGALDLKAVPKSILCIGGGYIGLELGTFYAKLGTEVTVVEAADRLLTLVEPEISQLLTKKLTTRGVKVLTQTKVMGSKITKQGVEVTLSDGKGEKKIVVEKVLVTVGRTPNSGGIGLEKAGVKVDTKGFISVDPSRRTNVPHIYAIGDIAGQPMLAHKGSKEGLVAADAIAGKKTVYDVVAMPAVIFTDPEIATVGLSEAEARAKSSDLKVGVFPFAANGRALSVAEPDGFVKMIGDGKTGRLLGVHIIGAEASNLISEAALAIEMGATVEDIALTVHPHPTLPETLMEAAEATLGHAVHIFQRKPQAQGPSARV